MADTPPGGENKLAFPAPLGSAGKPPATPKDTAPKPARGRPAGTTRLATLERGLQTNFAVIGTTVFAFNQFDGTVILNGSDDLAKALVNLAETNPKVRKALERMLTGTAYTELIFALGAIVLPIAGNHGMVPGPLGKMYAQPEPVEE